MQNSAGEFTDLYVPRKCSGTNRLITAKDVASIQLNIGLVDANGRYTNEYETIAISGYLRDKGESDQHITRLVTEAGLIRDIPNGPLL